MNLKLKDQKKEEEKIKPFIKDLEKALDSRKPVWDKMNSQQRQKWVDSEKDVIIKLAFETYKYLGTFFQGVE